MARVLRFFPLVLLLAMTPSAPAQEKADHESLSRLLRDLAIKRMPKYVEDLSGWGKSTPPPARLRLPGLPRTTIKVGDRVELAHGSWKRMKAWMANPERDLDLRVTRFEPVEGSKKYRLSVTVIAPVEGEGEFQQWLNGLMLVAVTGQARATVQTDLDFDVAMSLDVTKFPPEVTVDPKMVRCQFDIKEFELFKAQQARNPQRAEELNQEIKGLLQGLLQSQEPRIRDEANKAIAQGLREGRGTLSAAALYQVLTKTKTSAPEKKAP